MPQASAPGPVSPGPGTITSDQAAAKAKAAFPIPASLTEFHANYYENQGPAARKAWSLSWSEPQRPGSFRGTESLNVEVDAVSGEVRSMNHYRPLPDGVNTPAIHQTREEGLPQAEAVLQRLQPAHFSEMKLVPPQPNDLLYPGSLNGPVVYSYSWVRVVNGLPVSTQGLMQGAQVGVDASDGAVVSYFAAWSDSVTYPDPKGVLSAADALKIWQEKLGLELQYQLVNDVMGSGKPKAQLAYVWRLPYAGFAMDAYTGKVIDQHGQELPTGLFDQLLAWPQVAPAPAVQGPLDRDAALAFGKRVLGIDDTWQLTGANYSDNQGASQEASWNFNFNKATGSGDTKQMESASVNIGAISGKLLGFWRGMPYKPGDESLAPVLTRDQALAKALTFLATYFPTDVGSLRLAPSYYESFPGGPKPVRGYSFQFERLVNGVPFPAASLTVGVDGVTGDLTNFYSNAPGVEGAFPDKAGVLDQTKAMEAFAQQVGLELTYRVQMKNDASAVARKFGPWVDSLEPQAQLVYQIPAAYQNLRLDAFTSRVIDDLGRDVQMLLRPPKDVANHWAKRDITIVAARGLLPVNKDGLFEPDRALTRAEAARLVVLAFGRGEIRPLHARYSDVAMAAPLAGYIESAAGAGWLDVTDGSFRPDDPITRQDFAAMLIRALGYSKVAKMQVPISMTYTDQVSISPDLRNSVALSAGLGIFSPGGQFRPTAPLTKAEAAVTIMRVGAAR